MNWHDFFFNIADVCAKKSKDKNTQVGCAIAGPGNEIVSTGYNSFPRGIDDEVQARQERPEKYFWFEHAERNAIYNAARTGASLKDCTLYVPAIPCMDCARGIVQVGIKRIIIREKDTIRWMKKPKWDEQVSRAVKLFEEASVTLDVYRGEGYDTTPFNSWNFDRALQEEKGLNVKN